MRPALALLVLAGGTAMTARSDEGMWLPKDPPKELLKQKYGFDLTDVWQKRAMHGSVRFNNGGSGGFVSPDALIVTNHHIAADALQKLSTPQADLLRDGFHAKTRADERKCPDLELNVLQSIEDVTKRVNDAVGSDLDAAKAAASRRAVMAEIEKESLDKTGLRSDVVTLYNGGLYHLYRYKKYTDVRLVFAPESAIAAFGGDVDNFEYPRHSLDVAFFRAYENGATAKVSDYFKWSTVGPADGDLVFVTGHPGTTQRLETLAKLKHRRDVTLPYTLGRLRAMEAALTRYGDQSPEQRRQAATDLHRVANARKAFSGQYLGLLDPKVMDRKAQTELDELKTSVDQEVGRLKGELVTVFDTVNGEPKAPATAKPSQKAKGAGALVAIAQVADIQAKFAAFEKDYYLLERGDAFSSELFAIARHLVRMADEMPKRSAVRLREYRASNLESLKFQLFSPAPMPPDLERAKLAASLTFLAENLGGDHSIVKTALYPNRGWLVYGDPMRAMTPANNPAQQAVWLIAGTKLADVAERKRLADGGKAAIDASTDPMILLAKAVDADARALRKRYEEEVEEPERQAYAEIAKARFAAFGKAVAPDATFTLRLAFGTVKGYDVDGKTLPFQTTFGGAFERAAAFGNREPFVLPKRWLDGKAKLDLATPFDFVSTADTIGGNSGSPVLNRAGELVGVNFDRNRHGLVRNFVYTDVQARHIAVHCRAELEALRKLYDAGTLADELTAGK